MTPVNLQRFVFSSAGDLKLAELPQSAQREPKFGLRSFGPGARGARADERQRRKGCPLCNESATGCHVRVPRDVTFG
jgi:hypothetical protein